MPASAQTAAAGTLSGTAVLPVCGKFSGNKRFAQVAAAHSAWLAQAAAIRPLRMSGAKNAVRLCLYPAKTRAAASFNSSKIKNTQLVNKMKKQ